MDQDYEGSDENLGRQISEVFYGLVTKKVRSIDILPRLVSDGLVRENDRSIIHAMHDRGKIEEATQKLISVIGVSTEAGKWKCFMEALKQQGYELVLGILEGTIDNSDDDNNVGLIRLFNQKLINGLYLQNTGILAFLYEKDVITDSDLQKIRGKPSNADKVVDLLNCIPRRKSNWFKLFLESIIKAERDDIVEEICPEYLEKRMASGKGKEITSEADEELSKESVMYGEGGSYDSGDYASNIQSMNSLSPEKRFKPNYESNLSNMEEDNSVDKTYVKEMKQLNTDTETLNIQSEPEVVRVDSKEDFELKPIVLRPYQDELCQDALGGENVIICAPTGSGKTVVAMNIIKEHFKKTQGIKKVAFLVNQVALAEQQYNLFKEYFGLKIERITGEIQMASKIALSKLLQINDVIVMTSQILVDAIKEKDIEDITAFSMLIFDECHHTKGKHPFNQLMHMYMDVKFRHLVIDGKRFGEEDLDPPALPQVIGLTASVGVGKAKREEEAREHIKELCANLDVRKICEVSRDNEVELQKHTSVPVLSIETAQAKMNDVYHQKIAEIMNKIENDMKESPYLNEPDEEVEELRKVLKPPANKKQDNYVQWLSKLYRGIAEIDDRKTRKFFITCHKMLKIFQSALMVNSDCRAIDSYNYIEEEFSKGITPNQSTTDHEKLKAYYTNEKEKLLSLCLDPKNVNPKLEKLKKMIVEGFTENPNSRAIVFAKTLALVQKLKVWMDEVPELQKLNLKPETVTGTRTTVKKGGTTRKQQVEILECFKSGDTKLIIATSVAEEGLDIQKCNLVIRYDHVTNEIAMVQSRGRARAANSEYKVVASQESNSAKKEEVNLNRELMMKMALRKLQNENIGSFIEKRQKELKYARDSEKRVRGDRLLSAGEYELRCHGCNIFVCMSTDIRSIKDSQFTVIDKKFKKKSITKPHPSPSEFHVFQKQSKLFCKECDSDWGIIAINRKLNVCFPLLKIVSFTITDEADRKTTVNQWINVPFCIKKLEDDYFERAFEEESGNGLRDGYDSTDDN